MNWHVIESAEQLESVPDGNSITRLDPQLLALQSPDRHAVCLSADGKTLLGRLSLWWKETPAYEDETIGYIGHFAAADDKVCEYLLNEACRQLAAAGCTLAIAPIDGTTWRSYRLVSERGTAPPFFMEPDTPIEWADWFRQAGFDVLTSYSSAVNRQLEESLPRLERASERLAEAGVVIRSIQLEQIETELESIFDLSLRSFSKNYLYSPISKTEFMLMYQKIIPYLDPEFSFVAEHDDRLVGFMFAVPDLLEVRQQGKTDAVVGKTLAIDAARQYAGLGGVLVGRLYRAALANGYSAVIHALQHEANKSQGFGGDNVEIIRRYALYARKLQP